MARKKETIVDKIYYHLCALCMLVAGGFSIWGSMEQRAKVAWEASSKGCIAIAAVAFFCGVIAGIRLVRHFELAKTECELQELEAQLSRTKADYEGRREREAKTYANRLDAKDAEREEAIADLEARYQRVIADKDAKHKEEIAAYERAISGKDAGSSQVRAFDASVPSVAGDEATPHRVSSTDDMPIEQSSGGSEPDCVSVGITPYDWDEEIREIVRRVEALPPNLKQTLLVIKRHGGMNLVLPEAEVTSDDNPLCDFVEFDKLSYEGDGKFVYRLELSDYGAVAVDVAKDALLVSEYEHYLRKSR